MKTSRVDPHLLTASAIFAMGMLSPLPAASRATASPVVVARDTINLLMSPGVRGRIDTLNAVPSPSINLNEFIPTNPRGARVQYAFTLDTGWKNLQVHYVNRHDDLSLPATGSFGVADSSILAVFAEKDIHLQAENRWLYELLRTQLLLKSPHQDHLRTMCEIYRIIERYPEKLAERLIDVASRLAQDPERDSGALRKSDRALAGHVFDMECEGVDTLGAEWRLPTKPGSSASDRPIDSLRAGSFRGTLAINENAASRIVAQPHAVAGTASWRLELDTLDWRRKLTLRLALAGPEHVEYVIRTARADAPQQVLKVKNIASSHIDPRYYTASMSLRERGEERIYNDWDVVEDSVTFDVGGALSPDRVIRGTVHLQGTHKFSSRQETDAYPRQRISRVMEGVFAATFDSRPDSAQPTMTTDGQTKILQRALYDFALSWMNGRMHHSPSDSSSDNDRARAYLTNRWSEAAFVDSVAVGSKGAARTHARALRAGNLHSRCSEKRLNLRRLESMAVTSLLSIRYHYTVSPRCSWQQKLSLVHHGVSEMDLLCDCGTLHSLLQRRVSASAAGLAVALLVSCSSPAEPGRSDDLGPVPAGAFTTDTTGYLAQRLPGNLPRYQFRIISRFENRAASTIYLGRCYPDSPQPLFSVINTSPVESGYAQIWACVGHDRQFAVRAGEVRIDTLLVEGPNVFHGGTNVSIGVTEGDFRLYYDVRLAAGDGAPSAPDSMKLSNAFRVRTSTSGCPEC